MPKQENRKIVYALMQSTSRVKLYLYDEITKYGDFNWETWEEEESETSAKYFAEKLDEIPDGMPIDLYINSAGGDVYEANSIYANLARHGNVTAYIDGMAFSAASLVAMAADKIIMSVGATMLVHNAWISACGNAEQLRQAADNLDALMASNRGVYMQRFKGTEAELIDLMEREQILSTDDCMKYGFCDEVCASCGGGDDDKDKEEETGTAINDRISQLVEAAEEARRQTQQMASAAAAMKELIKPQKKEPKQEINYLKTFIGGIKRVGM